MEFDVAGLLFDMDGTLIDSTPAVRRSWHEWARRWDARDPFDDGHGPHGVPARAIVESVLPAERVEAGYADIVAMEVADVEGIVVLPGTRDLLASLPADGWAIVTSCSAPLARARLAAVGIAAPAVVTADDVPRGKPAPDPFLAGAALLGVDPADCLVFEDAPAGIAAAKAAGARSLALLTTNPAETLHADARVADVASVRAESFTDARGARIRITVA